MTTDEKFGEIIRAKRLEKKLTLEILSEQLGIAISTLHHYEKGDRGVSIGMFFEMCNVLELDPTEVQNTIKNNIKQ